MKILAIIGVICIPLPLVMHFSFLSLLIPLSEKAHGLVLNLIYQSPSQWNWFYAAITIGHKDGLRTQDAIRAFIALGLYHLIVVSGAHLSCLERLASWLGASRIATFLILFLFTFVNCFEPACLRAFVHWCLSQYAWPTASPFGNLWKSFLICCLLEPAYTQSITLQLSVAASLGMMWGTLLSPKRGWLQESLSNTLIVFFTYPFLISFAPCLRFIAIPMNILAKPVLEMCIFPFALVAVFLGPFKNYLDFVLSNAFAPLLRLYSLTFPQLCLGERKSSPWGFCFIFLLLSVTSLLTSLVLRYQMKRLLKSTS